MNTDMITAILMNHPSIDHNAGKLADEKKKMTDSTNFRTNNPDWANYTELEILIILQAWLYWQKMWNKGVGDFV